MKGIEKLLRVMAADSASCEPLMKQGFNRSFRLKAQFGKACI